MKPTSAEVPEKHHIEDRDSLEFIRTYEAEVVRTIEVALAK